MTEVEFYVLGDATPGKRERLACRIAEKAFDLGHRTFMHVRDEESARSLDELLWVFRDGSFLPHAMADQDSEAPILIDAGADPAVTPYLLINLADEVPAFFTRFERVAEVISDDPEVREAGRERFRFYRDRGYSLKTHKL